MVDEFIGGGYFGLLKNEVHTIKKNIKIKESEHFFHVGFVILGKSEVFSQIRSIIKWEIFFY